MEFKAIARKAKAFRAKISVLAELRQRDQYPWAMIKGGLMELLEGGGVQLTGDLVENDPVRRFVHSLGVGQWINPEWLVDNLRGAGILSQKDLLTLSRNLERYMENIPFLRVFGTSNQFGWVVFQVGLEGLPGQPKSPAPSRVPDPAAGMEGHAYVKQFLDTIDSDKQLGYLADGFIKAGLTDRIPLLHITADIELAAGAMPFLQDLSSGDQLIWAMVLVGLENLLESTDPGVLRQYRIAKRNPLKGSQARERASSFFPPLVHNSESSLQDLSPGRRLDRSQAEM